MTGGVEPAQPPALEVHGLTKSFGPVAALRGVDVQVAPGSVHALLGGNGSGKSTVVKILAGVYQADGGTVAFGLERLPARSYRAADGLRHGLRFVHQDVALVEGATIAENMAFVRGFPTAGGRIQWWSLHAATAALLDKFEIEASPRALVAGLRPADRTMVAIARALGDDGGEGVAPVLVLDEPTAALPRHESELLLAAVRRRAAAGQTVVLISHHLGEVLEVADDITVLRDGRTAGHLRAAGATQDDVITLMAGGSIAPLMRQAPAARAGVPVLRVTGLAAGPLTGVDLEVAGGEVVGVTGLVGSGRTSLVRAIFGDLPRRSGLVEVGGRPVAGHGPGAAMAAGVALVPEDRGRDAALPDHSLDDNLAAAVMGSYFTGGWMRRRRQQRDSAALIERFGVRSDSPATLLSALSGGNQQKAVLARWLRRRPRVLLLDEPTQGVDVVSRQQIYRLVREAAAQGCAVLVASSDAEELAMLCDRALVLAHGVVAAHVPTHEMDGDQLIRLVQTVNLSAGAHP